MKEKILLIDPSKCTGCRRCELACSYVKEGEFNPNKSRVRLSKIQESLLIIPMVCQQCDIPLCTFACPTRAISKDRETGIVTINEELCVGCNACFVACPLGGISVISGSEIPIKCDLCDGEPRCATECEYGAIKFVDKDEASSIKRREAIKELSKALEMIG